MLVPAICYKDELEKALAPYFYTKEMMYYEGWHINRLLRIETDSSGELKQYAVVSDSDKTNLLGYITYRANLYSSTVYSIGIFEFKQNTIFGRDLFNLVESLIEKFHIVEFRAVSKNPAVRSYDSLLKKHKDIGRKIILKDTFKDEDGVMHNTYIYEFINPNSKIKI